MFFLYYKYLRNTYMNIKTMKIEKDTVSKLPKALIKVYGILEDNSEIMIDIFEFDNEADADACLELLIPFLQAKSQK